MICLLYGDSRNFQQFMGRMSPEKFLHLTKPPIKICFY